MSRVIDAICWDGVYANISLFALFRYPISKNEIHFVTDAVMPVKEVVPFELVDEDGVIGKHHLYVFDIRLSSIPIDLENYLRFCLDKVLSKECDFAWFDMSECFDFHNLLAADCSGYIYGIAARGCIYELALNDECISSQEWRERVLDQRVRMQRLISL